MGTVTDIHRACFGIGELVSHKMFDYRGVVVDVDATFQATDEWYETVAKSRPPKDKPWYHVLVDGGDHSTYVAEQNLEADTSKSEVNHPMVPEFFDKFEAGRYRRDEPFN
ncbi:MAG: heat shock protein HspQ [Halioglobus sp.]|nr:heat shock protein HspQ [Halioglobus sp.]